METIYEVIHYYDEDGGFGDSCPTQETVGIFSDKEKAEAFVKKYAKPHAYAKPYAYLFCGDLQIRAKILNKPREEKNMWWLHNTEIELPDNWDEDEYEED